MTHKNGRMLLMLTCHFPPSAASGSFRMLGFVRHLPAFGWQTVVVAPPKTANEPADDQLAIELLTDTEILYTDWPDRGWVRHLASRLERSGIIDGHAVWLPRAFAACRRAIRLQRPAAIFTSGPPHSVHLLGLWLKHRYGLTWVADFRDPWVSNNDANDAPPTRWKKFWERAVFRHADRVIGNAPLACDALALAYPEYQSKFVAITNGFDPESFADAPSRPPDDQTVTILHAGEIYAGRDPRPLLEAIRRLNFASPTIQPKVVVRLLGRTDSGLQAEIDRLGLTQFVQVSGQVPYSESLRAMVQADILLLLDCPGRRIGVPAKLYEYIGAGRSILALAEPDGDTAWVLRVSGADYRLTSGQEPAAIAQAIEELVQHRRSGATPTSVSPAAARFTRGEMAANLASLLDELGGARLRRKPAAV